MNSKICSEILAYKVDSIEGMYPCIPSPVSPQDIVNSPFITATTCSISVAGTTVVTAMGVKGGVSGGYGRLSGEMGGEFEGRLFPYLGDINWNSHKTNEWCPRCRTYVKAGDVRAEGMGWVVCKECLWVISKGVVKSKFSRTLKMFK